MRYNGFKRNRNKFQEPKLKGTAVAVQNGNVDKAIRKLKKKLQESVIKNPSILQDNPLLKMYHDSNHNRLTAFFLLDYHFC